MRVNIDMYMLCLCVCVCAYICICTYVRVCICVIRSVFKCPITKMELVKSVNFLNIPDEQLLARIPAFY